MCTEEPRVGSFLVHRIYLAIQIENVACVLGAICDKTAFDETFELSFNLIYIFLCRVEFLLKKRNPHRV